MAARLKKMIGRKREAARRGLVLKFVELGERIRRLHLDVDEAARAGVISDEEEGLAAVALQAADDEIDSARPLLTGAC